MWQSIQINSNDNQTIKFYIEESGKKISVADFINNLIESKYFRFYYNTLLKDSSFIAFFWENIPFTKNSLTIDYEFSLVNSTSLMNQKSDPSAFDDYFKKEEEVVSFSNLRGDANLIVPCPNQNLDSYSHIGNFVRSSDMNQIDKLWEMVGNEISKSLRDNPIWLSTAGLGVPWLHIRIDSNPKYYRTLAYRNCIS